MKKSALRSYHDQAANAGWRIQLIPHDDPSKTIWHPTNWYALAGALVFCLGCLGILPGGKFLSWIFWAYVGGGFGFALISLLVAGRARRRGWLRIKAVCLDQERHTDVEGGCFRLLCRFEFQGKTHTVTPVDYWRNFSSKAALRGFLAKTIGEDGTCWLRVNPRNPLQTELATGLAHRLLFGDESVEPQHAADGNQPSRSAPNNAPGAAGSRR